MSEEAGFLAAIQAAAADNAPRLVYADWLDEQGRHDQAEFIRLEVQCRQVRTRLSELRATLDTDWTTQVFPANGLIVRSYPAGRKIYVVKLIREIVGCGLAEGKALAEQLPLTIGGTLSTLAVEAYRSNFAKLGVEIQEQYIPIGALPTRSPQARSRARKPT